MHRTGLNPRLTVRWLMVAVAVSAGILAFVLSTKGTYRVGFANVPLRFTILDDTNGRPIARASVRLPGSTVYEAQPTGDDGTTRLVIRVISENQGNILRRTRHANFASWRIRVVAPDYTTFTANLEDQTQDPRFHEENPSPPPIVIRLKRQSPPEANPGVNGRQKAD